MRNSLLVIFLLSIFNSVLFYGNSLGINVILFIIPTLIFLIWVLKNNDKVENKKGLLFTIPITLLSCTYFIYDNEFFRFLNGIVIPLLIICMYVYTITPVYSLGSLFTKTMSLIFEPLSCIGKVYRLLGSKVNGALKLSDKSKKIIKAIFITLPILIVVLLLLSSADVIFGNIFKDFVSIFKNISFGDIIGRSILIFILFTYFASVVNYLIFNYEDKPKKEKIGKGIENYTINLLITVLGVVYVIFDFIQIKSLMLHQVAEHINYSSYARSGFFQLLVIALINLVILVISKHVKDKGDKYTKVVSLVMVLLTLIIIVSSFMRMSMYESFYGYTLLRLLVYVTLITLIILLIPTTIYILKDKMNLFKSYLIVTVTIYTMLCLFPVDYFIAHNNINRYYEKNKIDIDYLENYSTDNVPLLVELYNETNDKKLKDELRSYLKEDLLFEEFNIFEYNISNNLAYKKIQDLK